MSDCVIHNNDCLEELKNIPDESVQLVLMDLPFGTVKNTTACKWDNIIPFDKLWPELKRILKPEGAIVGFAQQPFTSQLIMSNVEMYKYNWIWKKTKCTNFLNQRYQPGKCTEDICVFGKMACSYSPKGNMKYNPQMTKGKPYKSKGLGNRTASSVIRCKLKQKEIDNKGERLPTNVLEFKHDKEHFHPTQKPIDLLRYLIRTYTDEGDTVLDPTMGSGSAGVAAILENRDFVGIEKDENYFNIADKRIKETINGIRDEGEDKQVSDSENTVESSSD